MSSEVSGAGGSQGPQNINQNEELSNNQPVGTKEAATAATVIGSAIDAFIAPMMEAKEQL
ncbi:MAG: hypothetical protein SNF33_07545 [Candidatus Algichlamydia australiensis]|nr:hypothetical protein [Chlamydiales bacterium]